MSKHTTAPRTLSRRLVALLAALALLAAMALPVYAETQPEPPAQTQEPLEQDTDADMGNKAGTDTNAGTDNNSETNEGTGAGADTDSDDMNGNTSPNPGANSTTPAGGTEPSTDTTQPSSTDNTDTTTADEDTAADEDENNTNDTTSKNSSDNSGSPEDVQQQDDGEAEGTSLATQAEIETFRIYFVAPSSWGTLNASDKVCCYGQKNVTGDGDEKKFDEEMTGPEEGLVDGVSRKVYYIELTTGANDADAVNCPKGLYRLHFYNNNKVCQAIENHWTDINEFRNKCYYADENKWVSYKHFNPTDHTAFKKQTMAFKNATADALTDVVAHFYEKRDGELKPVDTCLLGKVDAGVKQTFKIPADACSYVQFTAGENNEGISSLYNFYGQTGDEESFLYNEKTQFCFVYSTNMAHWGTGAGRTIYYDATFSKLDAEHPDHAIPNENGKVYYRLWCSNSSNGSETKDGEMVKANGTGNLYVIDGVDSKYDHIIFSNNNFQNNDNGCGSRTGELAIPSEETPCFYADTSDDVTYNNKVRDGYWANVGALRDAEAGKSTDGNPKDVVKVYQVPFVADPATKYISTTLYDYYTDYELNGNSRTDYSISEGPSHRNWVTFREFDQAISDYYKSYDENRDNVNKILYPIYTGHFQPSVEGWNPFFADINKYLNLHGFSSDTSSDKYKAFRAANNSAGDEDTSATGKYAFAFQGIVANTLSKDGDLLMNSSTNSNGIYSATTLVEPHFNESFLSGANSKNAKLGEVYHNVSFPFTKKQIFSDEPGVDYWWYDSSKTSLYLREDTSKKQLYLGNDKNSDGTANYVNDRSKNLDSSGRAYGENNNEVSTRYGFFPFNESLNNQNGVASQYNYGYGAKLEIPFSITSDGKVESKDASGHKVRVPIRYYFSGDDDVWVFIDNKLVLDVGGAHGKVSGILDFSQTADQKNIVTAYVSQVKCNKYVGKEYGPNEENKGEQTKITYTINPNDYDINSVNTDPTTYYQKNPVEIKDLTTGTHTLTMYYMERGMWESNMAVAFNFPDHNELEVEKEVNVEQVDPLFKSLFQNKELFGFTIKNLATHYGPKDTEPLGKVTELAINNDNFTAAPNQQNTNTTFALDTPPDDDTGQVLHWYAAYDDEDSSDRENRYGVITLKDNVATSSLSDKAYLSFDVYTQNTENLDLNNLYLELVDGSGNRMGSLGTSGLSGKTYDDVLQLQAGEWTTIKLELSKLTKQGEFDLTNLKKIYIGDNYPLDLYIKNIKFTSKAAVTAAVGFTTAQDKIPDYGSAIDNTNNELKPAVGAQFTSNLSKSTQAVDENGRFQLKDGETITFKDQFRRGSYISVTEDADNTLYDTSWTIYENDEPVTQYTDGTTVSAVTKDLVGVRGNTPDDGRTEKAINPDGENHDTSDNSYYKYGENGAKPASNGTIVFRSYSKPDAKDTAELTRLKLKFTNKVKVGSIKIKKASDGTSVTGTFTFRVTYTNVGGKNLEGSEPVVEYYTVAVNNERTIPGIPAGTQYTIEEVLPTDSQTHLLGVTVDGGDSATVNNNKTVKGTVQADTSVTATFTNTTRTLIELKLVKEWKAEDGKTPLNDRDLPQKIYVQLQRRVKDGEWKSVNYPKENSPGYVEVGPKSAGWSYTFAGLDAHVLNEPSSIYEYRVVEGTLDKNKDFVQATGGTLLLNGHVYEVTGGTQTKDGNITLTNTRLNPKFDLDILKKSADEPNKPLPGVEFKLEKLNDNGTDVDSSFSEQIGVTNADGKPMLKDANGNSTTAAFTGLEPGKYRLTETKAAKDYNLLSAPIIITFTKEGKYQIGDGTLTSTADSNIFTGNAVNGYKLALTVLNRKTPTLPHTGADAPSLWLLIGLPLAVAGLLILVFRYNKKGGRQR